MQISGMVSGNTEKSAEIHGLCNKILVEHYELNGKQRAHLTNISDLPSLECACELREFLQAYRDSRGNSSRYVDRCPEIDNWYQQTHPEGIS
jgi:hypothetical protein